MTETTTPRLSLPFLQAGQALKNITHNEALQRLDTGLYLSCSNMAADNLPADPVEGHAYVISQTPDGSLMDRIGHIGVYVSSRWAWFIPKSGWVLWDETGATLRVFDGSDWAASFSESQAETLPFLGLNAAASADQRLSISSASSLFNHDGDSHRLTLNRASEADTASVIFQTNFGGGAELGLTGAGGFSLKISSDDGAFAEKMSASESYPGILSPAFASLRVSIESETAAFVETPATGGIFALMVVSDAGFPQASRSGIFAYDTGGTPVLVTLAKATRVDNHGALVLSGTTSEFGNIGVSAVEGGLYIENRTLNTRDISLTFLC